MNYISETLRIYPVSPILHRVCTKDYRLPDTNYLLEKGTPVVIPIRAIQNDPENYESPDVFNPDRFLLNNFNASGIYLPFGYGPRSCIGKYKPDLRLTLKERFYKNYEFIE